MTATWQIITGDCRASLETLRTGSVQTCVTSPPYFGLRDYGTGEWGGGDPACDHSIAPTQTVGNAPSNKSTLTTNNGAGPRPGDKFHADQRRDVARACPCGARRIDRQIGLEPTPDEFVTALVQVFRAVRRVLRDDGTVWLNLGDSYASSPPGIKTAERYKASGLTHPNGLRNGVLARETADKLDTSRLPGIKQKDLLGIPWMVAFALRADGWYLRSDIIWNKPNPMPESVTDRPTKSHEYVFLLSKGPRYFYDADAIREDATYVGQRGASLARIEGGMYPDGRGHNGLPAETANGEGGRNKRSVWTVTTQPYPGAHFATFPPKLIEPCILAGAPERACSTCGAPWERVVERTAMVVKPTPKREAWQAEDEHARTQTGGTMLEPPVSRTLGFAPSCDHDAPHRPGVVLDPFAGTGTTGMIALRHNRSFTGIELSPAYAELARDRIIADSPLLNTHAERTA